MGCTALAAPRTGDGALGLGAGFGGGAFLFFAEQTEHDSSEQLLAEEPDGDDFLGGGEGGRGRSRRCTGLLALRTGLRLIGLLLGLCRGARTGLRVRRRTGDLDFLGGGGDLERRGEPEPDLLSRYNCL